MINIAQDKELSVTVTRILNAPRELAFKAWTDPKQLQQWFGPHGFTNTFCEIDARPGGKLRICMDSPEFPNHWVGGEFKEIVAPERIVFTSTGFEDEHGNAALEGLNTVTFEEYNGKTKLTLHARLTKLPPELIAAYQGMETGWSQSFEKLQTLLSSSKN